MPVLALVTNVKIPNMKAFAVEFSKVGAETLGKPELYICTDIKHNETMSFNGTFEPAFTLTITSLDNINAEANDRYSNVFFKFFGEKLGVPGDRGYITFVDPGRAFIGHKGSTFATLWADKS